MRPFRFLSRLSVPALALGMVCVQPAQAQAEAPRAAADTTAQDSSLFDTRIARGHKPRRRGMRPTPTTTTTPLAPATTAPASSTATVVPVGEIAMQPPPPQLEREGSTYEAAPLTLNSVATRNTPPLAPTPEAEDELDVDTSEPIAVAAVDAPAPRVRAEDVPSISLAPEAGPLTLSEPLAEALDPVVDEATPEAMPEITDEAAAPSLFDTYLAEGHKEQAELDLPPPTYFDTRIASGHKDLVEREGVLFDYNVATGYKELPLPEPLAEYEAALGIRAAGQFVISPEGMEYVLAEAVRVGRLFNGSRKRRRAYFPMIERALQRRNLPLELKYLPLIESSMDPMAVSHAGARGLWQIMPGTAGDFGADSMAVHDPRTATNIGVEYLERLHRMFDGDWLLAIAAYNSGPGRVQGFTRQFQRTNGRPATYWDIRSRLPRETRDYVPRFLAAIFYAQSDV